MRSTMTGLISDRSSDAWLSAWLPSSRAGRWASALLTPVLGAALLAALAQVRVRLPWTPVPITGQTFGVAALALLFGSRFGGASALLYVAAGALGAPVFAGGASGLSIGPTLGYLVGMVAAAFAVGNLADRGWTRGFWRALAAAYVGSAVTFAFGLAGLSFFVPREALLEAGLLPFLFGDAVKNSLAAGLASAARSAR